jgi:hypothetical protein
MHLETKIKKPINLNSDLPSFSESIEEGLRSERIIAIKHLKKRSTWFHLDWMTFLILIFIVGRSSYISKWPWILPAAIALFLWNYTRSIEKRLEALILLSDVDSKIDPNKPNKASHHNPLPDPTLIIPRNHNP